MSEARRSWRQKRLRFLASFNPKVPPSLRQSEAHMPIFPMDVIHEFTSPSEPDFRPANELLQGYSYIDTTDVAYAKVTPCFENGKGLIGADLDGPSFATTEVTVLRPHRGTHQSFLAYALQSTLFRSQAIASMTGAGGLKRVSESEMRDFGLSIPDLDIQHAIVNYLNHETSEIGELIRDLEAFRELLKSRWSSELISRVQLGLADYPLAQVNLSTWPVAPTHWRAARLKSTIKSSNNGAWGADPGVDAITVRCIRVADFDKPRGTIHDLNVTERSFPADTPFRNGLKYGDLIIEKSGGGPTAPVGNVVRYEGSGGDMYSNFVARIVVADEFDSLYTLYLHQSLYEAGITARSIKQTTGIQNLDANAYFDEHVMLPPRAEQARIGHYLRSRRLDLDDSLLEIDRAITLAKERRAALITAAVTGQIDVTAKRRPAAEQLEDDIKELS